MPCSFEQVVEVFDDWCETLIPGGQIFGPLHELDSWLGEWDVEQWREALQDLLCRYAQVQVEGTTSEIVQVLEELEILREKGLPTAMQRLLFCPHLFMDPEGQATSVGVMLRALDLLELYELTEEETTQLEEFNEWKPWHWKGVSQLGEIEVNDYNTLLVEGGW